MRVVAHALRTLDAALALGTSAMAFARSHDDSVLISSLVTGPAVLLGAFQRAGRVVDLERCARDGVRVVRRDTSGTAAYVGGQACLFTLALPHVAALAPDARGSTLLNRNVRGFLKGFLAAGIRANYFGREWIAFERRPGALLGYACDEDGAVQLDVIAGVQTSIALPDALRTADESAVDHWRGYEPTTLAEQSRLAIEAIAAKVVEAHAERWGVALEPLVLESDDTSRENVTDPDAPFPRGARVYAETCPIGFLDVSMTDDGALRFGGDVLAAEHTLRCFADALGHEPDVAPVIHGDDIVDGARPEDFARAAAHARRLASGAANTPSR